MTNTTTKTAKPACEGSKTPLDSHLPISTKATPESRWRICSFCGKEVSDSYTDAGSNRIMKTHKVR